MKCYQHLCFVLIIFVLHASTIDGEIHRAKASSHRARRELQRVDVAASDLHRSQQSEMITEDGFSGASRSSEVWLYSLCGAILVGLSGIFPLAIIRLETGAALKHGGKYIIHWNGIVVDLSSSYFVATLADELTFFAH